MKRKGFSLLTSLLLMMSLEAQKDSFDIASFNSPRGWQRIDSNGVVLFQDYRTQNNQTSFCQIILFPSRTSNNPPEKNFNDEWNTHVSQTTGSKANPQTTTEKGADGWIAVTGVASINQQGITYNTMLLVASGFGRLMSVRVNIAGQDHVAEVENFFKSFDLDSKRVAKTSNANTQGSFDWNSYSFTAPEKWYSNKTKEFINLSQTPNNAEGCLITILPPQLSGGNLETDVRSIFDQMYPGWQYRNNGEKQYDISKGYTPQGLEYCMMEAPMRKPRPDGYYYDYEDGAVWVISMGNKIAIVAGRHNRLKECRCFSQYEYWRRFFNSFAIMNQQPSKMEGDLPKRIIGSWMASGSGALTEYIFAANGNYQFIGAYGTTSTVSRNYDEYLLIKSSSWSGDGKYTLNGNQITLKKYGDKNAEQIPFRIEKVNHGGTGWKERLYMLKTGSSDGKEYEVIYEKGNR